MDIYTQLESLYSILLLAASICCVDSFLLVMINAHKHLFFHLYLICLRSLCCYILFSKTYRSRHFTFLTHYLFINLSRPASDQDGSQLKITAIEFEWPFFLFLTILKGHGI